MLLPHDPLLPFSLTLSPPAMSPFNSLREFHFYHHGVFLRACTCMLVCVYVWKCAHVHKRCEKGATSHVCVEGQGQLCEVRSLFTLVDS